MSEQITAMLDRDGVRQTVQIIKEQQGFDGMTGQPLYVYKVADGFDAMTGQPVFRNVEHFEYDAMTGQPVYRISQAAPVQQSAPAYNANPAYAQQNAGYAQPNAGYTQQPAGYGSTPVQRFNPNTSGSGAGGFMASLKAMKLGPALIGIGAVALIAVIVVVGYSTGLFMSKRDKLARAIIKTVEDSTVGEMAINASKLAMSNKMTAEVNATGSVEGYGGSAKLILAQDKKAGKIYANAKVDVSGVTSQEASFYFDDSTIQAAVPTVLDDVYYYDFTKKNDEGFIAQAVTQYSRGSIEDVNKLLQAVSDMYKASSKYNDKLKSNLRKAYKKVEVEEIDPEKFTVDDKERKCTGYRMKIKQENVSDALKAISEADKSAFGDSRKALMEAIASLSGETDILYQEEMMFGDQMAYQIMDGMNEIDIDFFLYDGKLAAVKVLDGYNPVGLIEFKGGDKRCSNITVSEYRSSGEIRLDGSFVSHMDGKKEIASILDDRGNMVMSYTYDTKSGDFVLGVPGLGDFTGNLIVKDDKIKYSASSSGMVSAQISVDIKDSASISKLSGNRVDLGEMRQADLYGIAAKFMQIIPGFGGLGF